MITSVRCGPRWAFVLGCLALSELLTAVAALATWAARLRLAAAVGMRPTLCAVSVMPRLCCGICGFRLIFLEDEVGVFLVAFGGEADVVELDFVDA